MTGLKVKILEAKQDILEDEAAGQLWTQGHVIVLLTRSRDQCCGSETFISDPVSDPDPAFSEFRIRILDSNPDPDPEFESGLETGQNFFFLNVKNELKK